MVWLGVETFAIRGLLDIYEMTEGFKESSTAKVKKTAEETQNDRDVLIKVGPLKYRVPGKRQRVVLGSLVLILNLLLVLAVVAYFYVPSFQEFVFNFARD